MTAPENTPSDYVQEKTQRIVARVALKRARKTIANWQQDEHEKARLVKIILIVLPLLFAALIAFDLFFIRH